MIRFDGGVYEDIETENGFIKRVWLPKADTKNKSAGIPISLDFEDIAKRYNVPDGQRIQRLLFERGFVSKEDWDKIGIHYALVEGLQSAGYGTKRQCAELTDVIVREVRNLNIPT